MSDQPRRRARGRLATLALFAALAAGRAAGAEPAREDVVTYSRAWFDRFAPRTAYDLVLQVPGFALEELSETRGLASSGGNVLVDGKRPVAKSGGLAEVLSRIPAGDVRRVEVSRGAAGGSETHGQALMVNIVRDQEGGAGAWKLQLEHPGTPDLNFAGEATASRRLGDWEVTGKVQVDHNSRVYAYYARRDLDATGRMTQYQEEVSPAVSGGIFLSADAARRLAGGDLSINVRLGAQGSTRDRARANFATDAPGAPLVGRQALGDDIDTYSGELGAEWVRAHPQGWTVKLAGLGAWKQKGEDQWSQDGDRRQRSNFGVDERAWEGVGRVTLSHPGAVSPELGLEVAYNRLDSLVGSSLERGGALVAGSITRETTVVEELRAEPFANLDWTPSPRLTLEAGLATELSGISVGGTRHNQQSFLFVKPTFALGYRLSDAAQARLSLQRKVGQLDFSNFAAWASFSDGHTAVGNAALGPEQIWRAAASLDLRDAARGALNVELFYEQIDDVLEQAVLTSDGKVGLANVGDAQRWGVTTRGALPLGRLMPGGRLEVAANWKDSRFSDPISGQVRTLTYFTPFTGSVALRQDLRDLKLSWGIKAVSRERNLWWFVNERNFRYFGAGYSAFVETTRFLGVKIRLDLDNIGQRRHGEVRLFYSPDRSAPLKSLLINRRADREWVKLTVSRQF